MKRRQREEEEAEGSEEEEEEGGGVVEGLNNLTIETVGTEEEAADGLEAILGMGVEEGRDSKEGKGSDGIQRSLGALEFLTQDAYPSGTTLVN